MHLFFSVGEPSGDEHAAHLIQELKKVRPDVRVRGFGGPEMQKAGCQLDFELTTMAVMGFLRVLPMLFQFYKRVKQAEALLKEERPDAVVLIDFPGFNWWIARKAKAAGIPVYYYLPPQLWAWASYRIKRVRKYVDHVLCALPFEYDWYSKQGVKATFVGHPFFDEVEEHVLDREAMKLFESDGSLKVAVLPGSRGHEIARNWPLMLDVMQQVSQQCPHVKFLVGSYKKSHQAKCESMLAESGYDLPLTFMRGKASEVLELGDCCLMVSGSISLEVMARQTPAVVLYYVSRLTEIMGKLLIHCKYMALPNLIADRELMIEFPFAGDPTSRVKKMSDILVDWLSHPETLQAKKKELSDLREQVFATGASQNVAQLLVSELDQTNALTRTEAA